jgi:hypothetical protein
MGKRLKLIIENRGRKLPMGDLIFIGLVLAFWGVSYWLIVACERLRR